MVQGCSATQAMKPRQPATYAFKANVQTIKTQDEMMGSLLDVKA